MADAMNEQPTDLIHETMLLFFGLTTRDWKADHDRAQTALFPRVHLQLSVLAFEAWKRKHVGGHVFVPMFTVEPPHTRI